MEQSSAKFDEFYEIVGELGRGTTGTVYEARHTLLNRRVALKVPALSPEAEQAVKAQRFLRECQALAYLTGGPECCIPRLLVVAEHPAGYPYYARELVEGSTLEQGVAEGSIELRAGIAIVAETARVVEWVHRQGFVHRNLAPENVLVGRDGVARLIGFGRVGFLAGSALAPAGAGMPAEVDVRGLQDLLWWLCGALGRPVAAEVEPAALGASASAGAFGAALVSHLRSTPAEQDHFS